MAQAHLSDKGLSIFTFAAYHQLSSGGPVAEVVIRDHAGHSAEPEGVREVETAGLAKIKDDRAHFTDAGLDFLKVVIDSIRASAGKAQTGSQVA